MSNTRSFPFTPGRDESVKRMLVSRRRCVDTPQAKRLTIGWEKSIPAAIESATTYGK
jgi:hypothetical protein